MKDPLEELRLLCVDMELLDGSVSDNLQVLYLIYKEAGFAYYVIDKSEIIVDTDSCLSLMKTYSDYDILIELREYLDILDSYRDPLCRVLLEDYRTEQEIVKEYLEDEVKKRVDLLDGILEISPKVFSLLIYGAWTSVLLERVNSPATYLKDFYFIDYLTVVSEYSSY